MHRRVFFSSPVLGLMNPQRQRKRQHQQKYRAVKKTKEEGSMGSKLAGREVTSANSGCRE